MLRWIAFSRACSEPIVPSKPWILVESPWIWDWSWLARCFPAW
jgi:hypothetical protein